jgi:outer membrane biogenesis lipoprotein LolB
MMKTHSLALSLAALTVLVLSGCTTTTETTTTQTETDPSKRVYSQEELRKTGETNPAAALEKTDPSVRMSGPR